MRRTLGVAVFAGTLGVTLFGIFLTPVFYYVIQRLSEKMAADKLGKTRTDHRGRFIPDYLIHVP